MFSSIDRVTPSVLVGGLCFPEAPRWRGSRWWFSDVHGGLIYSVDLVGDVRIEAEFPGSPGGIGWDALGRLLVVSMHERQVLRWEPRGWVVHADLRDVLKTTANDLHVASDGDVWVGEFGYDLEAGAAPSPGSLVRIDPTGEVRVVSTSTMFPNGMAQLGSTVIVAETMGARLSVFDTQARVGTSSGTTWASLPGISPDGIDADTAGGVWLADVSNRRVLRVEHGGAVTRVIEVEGNRIYACALGGEAQSHLLLCRAPSFKSDVTRARRAGTVEVVEL